MCVVQVVFDFHQICWIRLVGFTVIDHVYLDLRVCSPCSQSRAPTACAAVNLLVDSCGNLFARVYMGCRLSGSHSNPCILLDQKL